MESYPHSLFIRSSVILIHMEGHKMDYSGLEKEIIRKQGAYIRQLEEQLDIYQEKDRAQELLIEEQGRMLDLLKDELSRGKGGKTKDTSKGK